jgi:cytochrome c553
MSKRGNPMSPVNIRNVPGTCGACHDGPLAAFQTSRHFTLLREGDARVPACTTCHGAVGSRRPSSVELEARCAECHGVAGIAPALDGMPAIRGLYATLDTARDLLRFAKPTIDSVRDKARHDQLAGAHARVEVLMIETVAATHRFDYDALDARRALLTRQVEALYALIRESRR